MSAGLEEIKSGGKTLAIIIRKNFGRQGVNFVTKESDPFQVGVLNHPKGYKVRSHTHKKIPKENDANQEFLLVISGKIEAKFYDAHKLVETAILRDGDALLQLEGGHGFKMLKPTKIIELKQGPYYGVEKEKEYIDE